MYSHNVTPVYSEGKAKGQYTHVSRATVLCLYSLIDRHLSAISLDVKRRMEHTWLKAAYSHWSKYIQIILIRKHTRRPRHVIYGLGQMLLEQWWLSLVTVIIVSCRPWVPTLTHFHKYNGVWDLYLPRN